MNREKALLLTGLFGGAAALAQIPMNECYAPSGTCTPASGEG